MGTLSVRRINEGALTNLIQSPLYTRAGFVSSTMEVVELRGGVAIALGWGRGGVGIW